MRVWCSTIIYEDAPVLRGMLESVKAFQPDTKLMPIQVVDGRYASFEKLTENGDSSDDAEALTREFGGLFLSGWGADGWPVQYVKRTSQFAAAAEGDWVLVVDADETLHGDWGRFTDWLNAYQNDHGRVLIRGTDDQIRGTGCAMHRLFRVSRGFHLFGAHYIHWRDAKTLCSRKEASRVPDDVLEFWHHTYQRGKDRRLAKEKYYGVCQRDEWRRVNLDKFVLA